MKILFYDLDGTLLIDGKISERALAALERVRAAGNKNVLNTGRSPGYVPPEVYALPVWDGRICGSAYIEWRGRILANACVPEASLMQTAEFCAARGIPVVYEGVTDSYSVGAREPDLYAALAAGKVPQITKITFWCDPARIRQEDFPGFRIVHFKNYAEGILEGWDKKTGMELIMREEGLTRRDLWAFGDSENDLEMLRYAGNAICMASSPAYFDDFCLYRAKSRDGVPEALTLFFSG